MSNSNLSNNERRQFFENLSAFMFFCMEKNCAV